MSGMGVPLLAGGVVNIGNWPYTTNVNVTNFNQNATLAANATQESGGNLDAINNQTKLNGTLAAKALAVAVAGPAGFVPMEVPSFLFGG